MISGPTTKPSTYKPTNKGRSRNWSGSDLTTLNHNNPNTNKNCTYECGLIRDLADFNCGATAFTTIRNSCDLSNAKSKCKAVRQKITIECLGTCPCFSDNGKRNLTNFYHKKERARNWSGSELSTLNHSTTTTDKNCTKTCHLRLLMSRPVCGSNGETYHNACMLENAACINPEQNIKVDCEGKCPCKHQSKRHCSQVCPLMFKPVCGSNEVTYDNYCLLVYAACVNPEQNIRVQCQKKCPCVLDLGPFGRSGSLQDCDRGCPKTLKPVCGSNGETYDNDCLLEIAACENPEQNITVECRKKCPCQSKGPSTEHPDCKHLGCHWLYNPVCGTDGQKYPNSGCLDLAACENPSQNITLGCKGECPCDNLMSTTTHKSEINSTLNDNEKCLKPCPEDNDPVCGSNGEVYGNSCLLRSVACQNPEKNITEDCKGECPCHNSTTPIHSDKARLMDELADDENSTIIHITSVPSVTNIPELQPNENFTDKVEYNCTFYAVCQESDINNKTVCGTDGETYTDKCELEIANCELQVDSLSHSSEEMSIELKCMGKCSECMDDEDTTKVGL